MKADYQFWKNASDCKKLVYLFIFEILYKISQPRMNNRTERNFRQPFEKSDPENESLFLAFEQQDEVLVK